MRLPLTMYGIVFLLAGGGIARAADSDICAALDAAYPQPGRTGQPGENAFRPLPVFAPVRTSPADPGTLSLGITVDHVSSAPAGAPGYVYVGNYPVTDLPVFRLTRGAQTSAQLQDPETGRARVMPDVCLANSSWGFGGSQWALVQGDKLDILFRSKLDYTGPAALEQPENGGVPCRSSNLHLHGLLISPYHPKRAGIGPYGDYVLDTTQPRGSKDFGSQFDDCGTNLTEVVHHGHGLTDLPLHYVDLIPGTPHVSSLESGQHPSGLFWFHPHPHGYSVSQVGGGTTGAITIGDIGDYACPTGDGVPGQCNLSGVDTRVMVLKETQIQFFGNGLWSALHSPDSGLCTPEGGTRRGECQGTDGNAASKWVFTVNGVQYPVVHVPANRTEIWRFVNSSASMTYDLSLVPGNAQGPPLSFQVLSKDGTSVAQPNGHAVRRTSLLMPPASRVEIAIPAPEEGGEYVLRNQAVQTGGNGSGDIWPRVDLAKFVWHSGGTANSDLLVTGALPPHPAASGAAPSPDAALSGPCHLGDGDHRVIYFVHRTTLGSDGPSEGPPTGVEVFGLIAGIRHADGRMDFWSADGKTVLHSVSAVWKDGTVSDFRYFPALGHNNYNTICTKQGAVEPWELQNWTGEMHNFHMHQSRFTLDPLGTFQLPLTDMKEAPLLRRTDEQVAQFVNLSALSYNDTVPVPRGQTLCAKDPKLSGCGGHADRECQGTPDAALCARPGIVSIIADFSRAEQVGTFVYHCHILEHEDGGMMAEVRVLCRDGDAACAAQQASASLCRPVNGAL